MNKAFFDVFPALKLNQALQDLMGETEVEKITSAKSRDILRIYLFSTRLIQKADIFAVEKEIVRQIFPQDVLKEKIL